MSAPQPVTLSPHAKSVIAAVFAVLLAGVTAWQTVTRDGFTWADLAPVAVAVLGVIGTDLIPNTGDQPVAKAIVHGLTAVASALATFLAADPAGVTAVKLLTVAVAGFLVWYVPELAPALTPAVTAGKVTPLEVTDALRVVAGDVSASMGPEPAAAPLPPVPASTPRQADTVPSSAYLLRDPAPAEPTPIADAALAATATATVPTT